MTFAIIKEKKKSFAFSKSQAIRIENSSVKLNKFLPDNLDLKTWKNIKPFFENLISRKIDSVTTLEKWMIDRSELESFIQDNSAWRYIRMTCDTGNKNFEKSYKYFVSKILTHILSANNELNKILIQSPFLNELRNDKYGIYIRNVNNEFSIFRKKNIPLLSKEQSEEKKYGSITGAMAVKIAGKELTMPQAAKLLKEKDRNYRESVYKKIANRRMEDSGKLNKLFSDLINIRNRIAINADFKNFRDYKFASLGRFDYTVEDCYNFHESVKYEIVPLSKYLAEKRKKQLGYSELRPWDMEVDPTGNDPLKPSKSGSELIKKTSNCFSRIDPLIKQCFDLLARANYLDIESRKNKAPGGYCYPLSEQGMSFIFMNSTNSFKDLITLVHEGGHALQSFLMNKLDLNAFKEIPSEVAEVASMSMELLSMDQWNQYFDDKEDLSRAKQQHLERIIDLFPWIAKVDKFQHWVYSNPSHSVKERTGKWAEISKEFSHGVINWHGFEEIYGNIWQSQIHIFESPFYYIEYGIAQLAAIALWRNYKENPSLTLKNYYKALSLGYTQSIPNIYKTAGIEFNFTRSYIKELAGFVKSELDKY